MKHTRLAAAICQELEVEGITLSALSGRIGRTQGAMSLLIGRGSRAASETLAALSKCWKSPASGVRIIIAHLHDEIERAGWKSGEYRISHKAGDLPATLSRLDRDLADLRAAAEHVPALACLVSDVLAVARAELPASVFGRSEKAKNLFAADPPEDYDPKRK